MDDKKDLAKQMYEKGAKYKDIAEQLDLSINTLKSWIKRYDWKRKGAPKDNRGAPKGNHNAKNNKGGAPPKRNKNALKTGEYETIFADTLTEEELSIYESLNDDPYIILSDEIKLLKIRQRRMMKRIAEAEKGLNDSETEYLYELRNQKKLVRNSNDQEVEIKIPEMTLIQKSEKNYRKINDILAIEDALTRVSNNLIKAIKRLNELAGTEHKNALLESQVKINKQKLSESSSDSDSQVIIVDEWKEKENESDEHTEERES
ncbi:phage terminase small subunit [Enterococcus cecorum]|uniref:phage terminase small subunit n=1 Tax=Enterococcus cecorum TaxID=44008 RepID=UPI003F24A84F